MKSLQEKVRKAMKWKKSISYMAAKFEVSEEKIKEIISIIREERKNMTPEASSANRPSKIFVTMLGTQIMNISDTGIQVFD